MLSVFVCLFYVCSPWFMLSDLLCIVYFFFILLRVLLCHICFHPVFSFLFSFLFLFFCLFSTDTVLYSVCLGPPRKRDGSSQGVIPNKELQYIFSRTHFLYGGPWYTIVSEIQMGVCGQIHIQYSFLVSLT